MKNSYIFRHVIQVKNFHCAELRIFDKEKNNLKKPKIGKNGPLPPWLRHFVEVHFFSRLLLYHKPKNQKISSFQDFDEFIIDEIFPSYSIDNGDTFL